jgi:hypothetical protein
MADVKSTHIGKCIVRFCAFDKNKKKNYDQQIALVEMEKNSYVYFIFGRASDPYLCLYNQLFALFRCVFKFLTP